MFYQKSIEDTLKDVESSMNGLSNQEVVKRQDSYGFNELKEKNKKSTFSLFVESFKDPLIIILLIASIVQVFLGEYIESIIIFAVLVLNSILGVTQTKKAEKSLDSLKKLSSPNAKVLRDGNKVTIPSREVVTGDLVYLDAGDHIPSDGRLIDAQSLKVIESSLTGESEPVLKHTETIEKIAPLGDQKNMVFSGSLVVYGRGAYIATAIGMDTEMGKIAGLIENAGQKQTPLQHKLEQFSKKLGIGILFLAIIIFGVQVLRGYISGNVNTTELIADSFMFSVAVAVAAIPEALSSIVTIVLAVGTKIMAKKNAIIRKLPAVETLGSTGIICTDKTGTLTQNKMTVVDFYMYGVEGDGLNIKGVELSEHERAILLISSLNNDSNINEGTEIGDPTEVALIRFAEKKNYNYQALREKYERMNELPFDSDRKIMSTVHDVDGNVLMFSKGAPDVILSRCIHALVDGVEQELTEDILNTYHQKIEAFSKRALRVLAFAYKDVPDEGFVPSLDDENDLVLVGLLAMIDPPREEVKEAIASAKNAGIKTIMITGDHKTTASAIGLEIGLMSEGDLALTGQELDELTNAELDDKLTQISVYARVSPENKIRIVEAWQRKGQVTAMTGDGVNDAPSLKQASIGIAMGSGTEVAKDASAMILVDDNFATIVKAVEIGRTVYENIKKSITYLFAGNLAAIIAILFAVIIGWSNPFTAIQLLFINLINDSLPAIALGLEPAQPNIMKNKPRNQTESILANGTLTTIILRGFTIGIMVIIAQYIGLQTSIETGVAMAFTTITLARIFQTISARSDYYTIFQLGFTSNKYVLLALLVCFSIFSTTFLPFMREIFTIPKEFTIQQFGIAFGLAFLSLVIMEVAKLFKDKTKRI